MVLGDFDGNVEREGKCERTQLVIDFLSFFFMPSGL